MLNEKQRAAKQAPYGGWIEMEGGSRTTSASALILTSDTGSGHRAVASAVSDCLRGAAIDVGTATVCDEDRAFRFLPATYGLLNRRLPHLWAIYYRSRMTRPGFAINRQVVRHRLVVALRPLTQGIDCIVLTHSIYCHALDVLRPAECRAVVVVTDLFGGPREWFSPGADMYIVPSTRSYALGLECGVPAEKLLLRRLPTSVSLGSHKRDPALLDPNARPVRRVLIVGGGDGVGPIEAVVQGLRAARPELQLTIACGRNARLRGRLAKFASANIHVDAFIPNLAQAMGNYDLCITKPGSVTLMELMTLKKPFLLMRGIPGIEAANAKAICDISGFPLLTNRDSAFAVISAVLDPQLRLSSRARASFARLSSFAESLPVHVASPLDLFGVPA